MARQKKINLPKLPKPTAGETNRYVGVLLERIQDQFELLAEGQEALGRRLGTVEQKLEALMSEVLAIKAELRTLKNTLERKADRDQLEGLGRRVAQVERELATLRRSR